MDEQPNDQPLFSSFTDLQQQHLQLMRDLRGDNIVATDDAQRRSRIERFVELAKNTGAILEGNEREAAQNILDYWSAETISFSDISQKGWSPPKLRAFERAAAASQGAPSDVNQVRQDGRKSIQLAAAARLWKDSKASGYLLKGSALEEAKQFKNDPDIAELIWASQRSVRTEHLIYGLVIAVFGLVVLAFGLVGYVLKQKAFYETEKASYEARNGDRIAKELSDQISQQQQKICDLTGELSKARVTVSKEVTETFPSSVTKGGDTRYDPVNPGPPGPNAVQRGYIWLGSDDKPNLLDVQANFPVKPGEVQVGGKYKLAKNVVRSGPPSDEYVQTNSIGVVPEQTILQVTSPPTPYPRSTIQYWAAVEVENPNQPIVYIEYANGTPELAQSVAQKIKTESFRVPGVESTELAKGLNDIRFYYEFDRSAAQKLANTITSNARDLRLQGLTTPKVVDMTTKAGPRNFPGVIELWIDLSATKS